MLSLLLVGVGIVVTASFFVGPPTPDAEAEVPPAEKVSTANRQPDVPVAADKIDKAIERQHREVAQQGVAHKRVVKKKVVPRGPENKMLRMTIPKMAQIRNDTVPYSESDDKDAFHDHAAVHLQGTGQPWDRHANVYIAGHRLGFPGPTVGSPSGTSTCFTRAIWFTCGTRMGTVTPTGCSRNSSLGPTRWR